MVTKDRREPGGQTSFSVIIGFTQAIQEMPGPGKHNFLLVIFTSVSQTEFTHWGTDYGLDTYVSDTSNNVCVIESP